MRIEKGFVRGLVIGIAVFICTAFWNACSKRFPAILRTFTRLTLAISFAAGALALATAAQASSSSLRDLPQEMQGAVSGALGLDDRSYHVEQAGENCRGVNAEQQFEAKWSQDGLAIQAGKLTWGLRLEAWGYGDELAPAGRALPQANEHRVEYHRSGLTEWYVNGPLGIEQGFTVLSPPKGTSSGGALTVRLAWSGEARVQVEEQSAAVVSNFAGEPVLRFSGLSARDASGRGLRTWLEQRGAAILLRVDDREATYPVVIDPLIQDQKLTASDGAANDTFGFSVSLSGDGNTALIGADLATVGSNYYQGAAYVFIRSGGTWSQQQKLTSSDGAGYNNFGHSVSLSADGSTAFIGAYSDMVGANPGQGAAYVFVLSGGTWSQQQKLTASDGAAGAGFGNSVSLSTDGNTALIGANGATVGANAYQGAAYVFVNSGGTWSQQQELTASDGAADDSFGCSVSLSADGNTALIGADSAKVGTHSALGAAYVFVRSGETWSEQEKLTASDGGMTDQFGWSVSLSADGSTALIGASGATVGTNSFQGAAYVFVLSGGTWSQQQKLTASDGAAGALLGCSVSLSTDGNTALIGANGATAGGNTSQGAAYVFVNSGGTWSQQQKLTSSDGAAGYEFGCSVSLSADGNTALIGAYNTTVGANTNQGAAYVYVQSGSLTVTIGPSVAVNAGAMWNVDGGSWRTSGTTVSGITVGSHTVAFNNIAGWTTPPNQTANISDGQTTSLVGSYVQIPQTGSLTVTIGPAGAVTAGAMWDVDGGSTWYVSGAVVSNLSVSMHTIGFNNVQGWTTPSSQTFNISNGKTTSLSGTYVQQTGSLTVAISPADVVTAGAMWNVDGGSWQASGTTVSGMTAGSHTVAFNNISGWTAPSSQTATIMNGTTTSLSGAYVQQTGSLTVTIGPSGAVTAGAMWNVDGGGWQASGTTVSGITAGTHAVAFNNISGWTTPSGQTANIANGTTASLSGTYAQQTGSLTVTISPSGAVTAGAMWNVDGGGWQASGTTVSGITVGSHTVAFNNISGWPTPSSQTANNSNGTTTFLSGSYVQQTTDGFSVLHSFGSVANDGAYPLGSLTLSGSTFYGMTAGVYYKTFGLGDNVDGNSTIFRINTDGTGYQVLHSFGIGSINNGANPMGNLTISGSTIYGMTYGAGAYGTGTIFQINTDGTGYQVLHSFGSIANDGSYPYGSLTLSGTTLYGMTSDGGAYGAGTIFQINTDGTGYQVLHSFGVANDGSSPYGSLTLSGTTLYGMTAYGGAYRAGTIFQINTDGTGYQVLYSYGGSPYDGYNPQGAFIVSGSTLYGVTEGGGAANWGTIFQINTSGGGYQVLYSFAGYPNDGAWPFSSLTLSGSTLYGMTCYGGSGGWGGYGLGTIFQINTDGTGYQTLYDFGSSANDGSIPNGSPTLLGSTLYGMAYAGGIHGKGTIFSVGGAPAVPGAPTGVTAAAGIAQAAVSFTAPASGPPVSSYTVTSNPGGITATGSGSPIIVEGLTNGTAYTFTVTATNPIGTGPPSGPSNSVTPYAVPPSYIAALAGTWNANFIVSDSVAPEWERGTVTVNPDGTFSGVSITDNNGNPDQVINNGASAFWSSPAGLFLTTGQPNNILCQIDSGNTVIACTQTVLSNGSPRLLIFTRQASTCSLADVTGAWEGNFLTYSGNGAGAAYTAFVTINPNGTWTDSAFGDTGTWSISSTGVTTNPSDSTFSGVLGADKTVMVTTSGGYTDPSSGSISPAVLSVCAKQAATYLPEDLAGTWQGNSLSMYSWERDTLTINQDGTFTMSSTGSDGSTNNNTTGTVTLSPGGAITLIVDPGSSQSIIYGDMAADKTVMVTTALSSIYDYIEIFTKSAAGSLTVTISPDAAVSAGAMWSVDGEAWQASGSTISNLSVGQHTVAFNNISGWTTPSSQTFNISNGTTASLSGAYVQQTDSLTVAISPADSCDCRRDVERGRGDHLVCQRCGCTEPERGIAHGSFQ